MYLSNKLFRSAQPALNLNLPDASTPQEAQVCGLLSVPLKPLLSPAFNACALQVPEVVVSGGSSIPRDAGGAIDYSALAQLLRNTQSLQDQADILYILFKDKSGARAQGPRWCCRLSAVNWLLWCVLAAGGWSGTRACTAKAPPSGLC